MDIERKNEYLRVLYHELGHWFVAKQVGFNPLYIKVKSEWASTWVSSGHCSTALYCLCKQENVTDYLIDRQLVLLAGAVFEAVYLNVSTECAIYNLQNDTASNDNEKFMELAMLSLNLLLGKFGSKVDDLYERSNKLQRDCLHEEILMHRKDLVEIIFLVCRNKINHFFDEVGCIFDDYLESQGDIGEVEIPSEALDIAYKSIIKDVYFFKDASAFRKGFFRNL
ncbi:hypothetical protein RZP29_29085 [Klebsiella quasipneumoniae subsp. similipneumoniae]|uniref:Peptidase M41 domain-containing protein n=1 Tax=Klebsiella quasipneumoniae subsp. similipneumoniae TaxID=1463164 RepID=A0AAE4MX42_9ENTR|nr:MULTISPECIES: hypothetical protein [Klebsiella]EIW8527868.1 hypothetical protein [Klebsiella pneumoniae]MBN2969420.1 hypothetical protein [Klebsiella pneumoniae]MBQ5019869.1 hypothetical protein [Klebsiella pneumoniae]MBQ5042868.1 hypothetical protein [Klebsiella pneumoniae]MCJ6114060.1 hypothetical protein [Klebsiella variicola]